MEEESHASIDKLARKDGVRSGRQCRLAEHADVRTASPSLSRAGQTLRCGRHQWFDGLFDFAWSSLGTVRVFRGQVGDTFALANSFALAGAAGVALGDLDGDSQIDIIVGSAADQSIRVGCGDGAFGFVFGGPIVVGVDPHTVVVADICQNGSPVILVSNHGQTNARVILDGDTTPVVLTVDEFANPAIVCTEQGSEPCNNYTEPDCDPTPAFPGIQECMRAAGCRSGKCHWAACIECHDGNGCHWYERPRWVAENLACGAVTDAELAGCLVEIVPL